MTQLFGDRLAAAIEAKGSICVGLDPRLESIPAIVTAEAGRHETAESRARAAIAGFHRIVIDAVAELVPIVKLQLAFYEQYGIGGLMAYQDTVAAARAAGLLVIADAKRNDVPSTAEAYARAFLRPTAGDASPAFEADAVTVNPFLGRDSLAPFVAEATAAGKGVFILVKTSNPGSGDLQDLVVADGRPLYATVADLTTSIGAPFVGTSGYSSIGAVVGCTHVAAAAEVRNLLPHAIVLVVGYGAQTGDGRGVARCYQPDRRGAIVNASRSVTYRLPATDSLAELRAAIRGNVVAMEADLASAGGAAVG